MLTNALEDPSRVDDWQILLDGERPPGRAVDYEYIHALEE